MFPAHAGMNRPVASLQGELHVPRTRGDEPRAIGFFMFPAHAGMNRPPYNLLNSIGNVPRTRGDELLVV